MYEGEIVGEFPPTASEEQLGIAMTGGGRGQEAGARERPRATTPRHRRAAPAGRPGWARGQAVEFSAGYASPSAPEASSHRS